MIILRDNKVLIELENSGGLDGLVRVKRALHSMLINIDTENNTNKIIEDVVQIGWLLKSMDFNDDQMWQIQQVINKNKELAEHFINPVPDSV